VRLGEVEPLLLIFRLLFELDFDPDTLDESVRLDRDVEDDFGRDDLLPLDLVDDVLRFFAIGYLRLDWQSVCA
jgi:hypothetical protein